MNKVFTKTQLQQIDFFLKNELKSIQTQMVFRVKSEKKTKKFLTDYSKALSFNTKKSNPIILN